MRALLSQRLLSCTFMVLVSTSHAEIDGARHIDLWNYANCIELSNDDTVVVLGPQVGGRVLKYSWKGKEALYLDPKEKEWTPETPLNERVVSAGRFDIGPEYLVKRGLELWAGKWDAEIVGPRRARLVSAMDSWSGVQLIREFILDEESSRLDCRQTILNHSQETVRWCHWSRTFAKHGGIVAIPTTPDLSRMPRQYVMVEGRGRINAHPKDPNIREREGFLEILAPPAYPKLGMDSFAGWFAYVTPDDLAFVKSYPADPKAVYNEVAGYTISIWYPTPDKIPACELEPIGPQFELPPGVSRAFTETWHLLAHEFPDEGENLDLKGLSTKVKNLTVPSE